jgi:hypothetical protein
MLDWLRKRWPSLWDRATKLETVLALAGFLVSTGIFTWLGNGLNAIAAHGWSAIILFGIAATCVLMVCAATFLVGLRYFNPLPPSVGVPKKGAAASPAPKDDPETNRDSDRRRIDFESVMQNAEYDAEHELEKTPMEKRPAGIDPLALRKRSITRNQFEKALQFLRRERRAVEERLLLQRAQLIERKDQREKPRR